MVVMSCNGCNVTDKKPQKLNCNIPFYFKSIEQTITFKLCFISQFKCNGLHNSLQLLINSPVFSYNIVYK